MIVAMHTKALIRTTAIKSATQAMTALTSILFTAQSSCCPRKFTMQFGGSFHIGGVSGLSSWE
jgi:hypothetical protein